MNIKEHVILDLSEVNRSNVQVMDRYLT